MYDVERIAKMEKIMNEKIEEIEGLRKDLEKFFTTYDAFILITEVRNIMKIMRL